MDAEWLIVGGGIHGVHIATRLLGEGGIASDQLLIIDPGERLLDRWRVCTTTTGMTQLRSPSVHNLGLEPMSLNQYASNTNTQMDRFHCEVQRTAYDIPHLDLFDAHCDELIETFQLDQLHLRARATGCTLACGGVSVQLSIGQAITAQHMVLAIGSSEHPDRPVWAPKNGAMISHVFGA